MSDQFIHIKKGVTLDNFFLGIGILIASIAAIIYIHFFLGLPLLYLGLAILLSVKGVIIDVENRKLKSYFDFFIFKTGNWENIATYNKVTLELTNKSQQMNSRGSSTNVKTKTYDIFLTDSTWRKIELKDFTDYAEAKELLNTMATALKITSVDHYAEARKNAKSRIKR